MFFNKYISLRYFLKPWLCLILALALGTRGVCPAAISRGWKRVRAGPPRGPGVPVPAPRGGELRVSRRRRRSLAAAAPGIFAAWASCSAAGPGGGSSGTDTVTILSASRAGWRLSALRQGQGSSIGTGRSMEAGRALGKPGGGAGASYRGKRRLPSLPACPSQNTALWLWPEVENASATGFCSRRVENYSCFVRAFTCRWEAGCDLLFLPPPRQDRRAQDEQQPLWAVAEGWLERGTAPVWAGAQGTPERPAPPELRLAAGRAVPWLKPAVKGVCLEVFHSVWGAAAQKVLGSSPPVGWGLRTFWDMPDSCKGAGS